MLVVDGIFPVSAPIPTPSSEASGHEASFEKDPHDNALAFVGLIVGSLRLRRCDVSLPLGILDWINVLPRRGETMRGDRCSAGEGARVVSRHGFIIVDLIFVDQACDKCGTF
jgi:hypothetical protein